MHKRIHYPVKLACENISLALSNQYAASRYGIPVLESERDSYGPADYLSLGPVPQHFKRTAASVVHEWATMPGRTEPQIEAARMFLRQWPKGPQIADPGPQAPAGGNEKEK